MLGDGYHALAPGKLAAVVTSLEMRTRAAARPEVAGEGWTLRHETRPDVARYRALFAALGRDWLWASRLAMPEAELAAILADPAVEVHVLSADGRDQGLLELDFRIAGACEVAFFAVSGALQGRGAGRWLMNRALDLAWDRPIERLWVHTCTLDHPAALDFYRRTGFVPFRRQVEVFDDPRATGLVERGAAPQVPLL